jgi:hypothetical protein
MNFAGKVRECMVPKRITGEKQAAGLQVWIGLSILPNHVFIGVKAVVNEDRELADLGKHLR